MKTVFIVYFGWDYEGGKILGVFTTKEKAQEKLDMIQTYENRRGDYQGIVEATLNEVKEFNI